MSLMGGRFYVPNTNSMRRGKGDGQNRINRTLISFHSIEVFVHDNTCDFSHVGWFNTPPSRCIVNIINSHLGHHE